MTTTDLLNSCNEIFDAAIKWIIMLLSFEHPLLSIPTYIAIVAAAIELKKKLF